MPFQKRNQVGPRSICVYIQKIFMPTKEENQLIDLANDGGLKTAFQNSSPPAFWIKANREYLEVATKSITTFLLLSAFIFAKQVFLQ